MKQGSVILHQDFRSWLESLPGDAPVGIPQWHRCCPVATYLNSLEGVSDASVGVVSASIAVPVEGIVTQETRVYYDRVVSLFIILVDTRQKEHGLTGLITARLALEILDEAWRQCYPGGVA